MLFTKSYTYAQNIIGYVQIKTLRTCNTFNAICVVFCMGCLEEYIVEIGVGKTK